MLTVAGYIYGSHPALGLFTLQWGSPGLNLLIATICRLSRTTNVRKALAFWREGKRLDEVHDGYAFVSFYKVIESQFKDGRNRARWIAEHIDKLEDRAGARVAELRASGIDVASHLFESGRCAVAHASLEGEIVDPDIAEDRRRLSADLVIIEELARLYIRDELGIHESTLRVAKNALDIKSTKNKGSGEWYWSISSS